MFNEGIEIEWISGKEYIKVDLKELSASSKITSTIQVWKADGRANQFNVTSKIKIDGDSLEIELTYDKKNNTEIDDHPSYWGRSTIIIPIESGDGHATWKGSETDEFNGKVDVKRLPSGLTGKTKRQTISRIQRDQQQLRAALLLMDRVCAITSEEFPDVLDAAHIIAAKRGGREIIENAILLRADIHRLLDSGAISINIDGSIKILKELPSGYKDLLLDKRIAPTVNERVLKALQHVANAAR